MRDPFHIIRTARITEKATSLGEKHNQYIFEVDQKATKLEIRAAITEVFKKTVVRVNTMRVKGKPKRSRTGKPGRQVHWKKAIVTLKQGEKLELV
ncbi:MAG: 50S ribosomal protein L23 [bacterium]